MINYQLCKEFPAFTPYEIDDTSFHSVIKLDSDVRTMQIQNEKIEKQINDPDRVVRRPAGDNWF